MNTAIIAKMVTSRSAKKIYKKVAISSIKTAGAITGQVVTYFAADKIIKTIREKKHITPVEPLTIKLVGESPTVVVPE